MPSLSVTTTTTQVVKLSPALKKKLLLKCKTYASLKLQRDAADLAMTKQRTEVEFIMEEAGESKLEIEGFKTTLIAPVKKGKFNPKKAIALGITTEQIEKSMDPDTPGKSYIKISVPGEKEAE